MEFENYRPVSCLPAAAKLLELVACQQTSKYMEDNNLLPKSQHGFRSMRSTMTAHTEVQKQWADNSEGKEKNWYSYVGSLCLLRLPGYHNFMSKTKAVWLWSKYLTQHKYGAMAHWLLKLQIIKLSKGTDKNLCVYPTNLKITIHAKISPLYQPKWLITNLHINLCRCKKYFSHL